MYRAAADMALFGFVRRYQRPDLDQRAHLVNALCKTFDDAARAQREAAVVLAVDRAALSAGREAEIDPAHTAAAMHRYERTTGAVLSI